MPLPPRLFLDCRWVGDARPAPAGDAACNAGKQGWQTGGDWYGGGKRMNSNPPQKRGLTAIDGAMALIVILLIVQIWLLSATLESYLAGHREAALPGAIISGILFAACLGLYRFVDRIDSEIRRS